ncbi:MAG: serine hydrolase [Sphingomonadaceae bacterium]|nr:serine hydrolase [Sphingomonadaceae bacterium]
MLNLAFGAAVAAALHCVTPSALAQEVNSEADDLAEDTSQAQLLTTRLNDVITVLVGDVEAQAVFAPSFLAAVTPEQLAGLIQQLEQQFGKLEGVESVTPTGPYSANIALRFENAIGRGTMHLAPDGEHLVVGLLLSDFETLNDTPEAIEAELESLPGMVSVLYTPLDGWADPVIALNPDKQMAIGSTFKLYVLSALARRVAEGRNGWDQGVRLSVRSLPSGRMQNWPEQTPVTVATLAIMMISISDNTATDQLIDLIGRDTVEREVLASGHSQPDRMLPFLTTLELFALKGDEARGGLYAMANEEQQQDMLADLGRETGGDAANIIPPTFARPHAIDTLEWFASAQDVRGILERIKALDEPIARKILAVNPSVPGPMRDKWAYIGFKGGSEPGVLNLSWLLQDDTGEWHVLVMSWNNPEEDVDKQKFELLGLRIMGLARR